MTKSSFIQSFKIAAIASLVVGVGCGYPIKVEIPGDAQDLPTPYFLARDFTADAAMPNYSNIKVYSMTKGCSIPECPLMWHVAVNPRRSGSEIRYGSLPGVGANTLVAPRELQKGTNYTLVLSSNGVVGNDESIEGKYRFSITDTGRIIPRPKD